MKTILWLDDCRDPKEWKDYIRVLCPVTSYYLYEIV